MEEGRDKITSVRPYLHLIITVQGLLQPVALGQLLIELCTCHATVGGASWNTGIGHVSPTGTEGCAYCPMLNTEEEEDIGWVISPCASHHNPLCTRLRLSSLTTLQHYHSFSGWSCLGFIPDSATSFPWVCYAECISGTSDIYFFILKVCIYQQ